MISFNRTATDPFASFFGRVERQRRRHALKIVVLLGGESAEREVSLRSGAAVTEALKAAGHEVLAVDPAHTPLPQLEWRGVDACFIALHGGAGEDGRIQQQLERLAVPYTGSAPEACRLAMNKCLAKERFLDQSVPTAPFVRIEPGDTPAQVSRRVASLGYPLVIKPNCQGSSIGVVVVDDERQLADRLAEARRHDAVCLAEPRIVGREFTVAVLDDRALPLLEVVSPEPLFSYDAKYQSSLTEYRFDFELDPRRRVEIVHAAVAATRALGTAGLVRVDLMLAHDGHAYVLEVNTVPGMTPRSLAPLAAAKAGLEMPALCDRLVRQCLISAGAL
jgi:D-alanine-D-alanine ligase